MFNGFQRILLHHIDKQWFFIDSVKGFTIRVGRT